MASIPLWYRLEVCLDWRNFWHCVGFACWHIGYDRRPLCALRLSWFLFWDMGCWQPLGSETVRGKWRKLRHYREHNEWPEVT